MSKMEFLQEYLHVKSLLPLKEPKLEFDFKQVFERSEFMKLLKESVERDLETETKDE